MRERARDEGGWGGVNVGEFGKCGLGVGKSHRRVHADGDRTTMSLEGLCSEREARWFYVGWSRVYDAMQPFFTSDEMREAGLDLLPGGINGTQQILDVGAGTGTLSLQVLKRAPGARLTLLDQSAPMLDRAKLKPALEGATFVLADAQALPLDDDSFDAVVSSGSLYYYPRPVAALREQLRVVRPGGSVLAMGSLQPKPRLIRLLATTFNRFPTEEQYKQWFADAGFSDVRVRHISNPWNAQQYALAICGTKGPGTAQPARELPPPPTAGRTLRSLLWLPVAIGRFGLSMAAFALLGPLQIINATIGMRKLRQASAATGESAA